MYNKIIFSIFFSIFFQFQIFSQINYLQNSFGRVDYVRNVNMMFKDADINLYFNYDEQPYYYNDYKEGIVYLNQKNDIPIYVNKMKLDLYKNTILFKDDKNIDRIVNQSVKKVIFIDDTISKKIISNFEWIEMNDFKGFAEIMNEGNVQIKLYTKYVFQDRYYKPMEGYVNPTFNKFNYYIISNKINAKTGILKKVNLKSLQEYINLNNEDYIFIKQNKLKLNEIKDIVILLNYLNQKK